jgi:hypothetical protein
MARRKTERDKELRDNAHLLRAWKRWHREQLEEALADVHADVMRRLMAQLKNLGSARELVAFIDAQDWAAVDADTRAIALHEINDAITKLRVRQGIKPIDDALVELGQPLRAFQLIKKIVTNFPQFAGEPPPGYGTTPDKTGS